MDGHYVATGLLQLTFDYTRLHVTVALGAMQIRHFGSMYE